jgi:cytoskeletal protein CcmA (bactofilin family)
MLRIWSSPSEGTGQTQASQESDSSTSNSANRPGGDYPRPPVEIAPAQRTLTESEMTAREIEDGTLSGFISSGAFVTGEAKFKAMLRIDGHFSGRITSRDGELIVGFGGRVDAIVDVSVVTVQGIVDGDLIASRRIELGRAAIVTGNIRTPSLVIAQGATFEGICKMAQQPAGVELSTQSDGPHDARQPARLGS